MSNQRPGMFMPALVGGAIAGALSAVPIVGCFCCLWIIGGAFLASYLLSKDSQVPLNAGDGAIVGILTGIIAAIADFIVSIPFEAMTENFFQNIMERVSEYAEEMPSGWESWLDKGDSPFFSLIGLVITAFIFSALGALGGIIGISIFSKKQAQKKHGVVNVTKDSSDS